MPDDVPEVKPDAPQPNPLEEQIKALQANNSRLTNELRKAREKAAQAAEVAGFDPAKDDPQKIAQARAAEALRAQERAAKIEKAVMRGLVTKGTKLDEEVADLILTGAISNPRITADESGVWGVQEYLEKVLASFGKPAETAQPPIESARLPRTQPPGDIDAIYVGKSFMDLVNMGPDHVQAFAAKHADKYEKLKAEWAAGMANPHRQIFIAPTSAK